MKYLILCVILSAVAAGILLGCSGKTPDNLGLTNGKLAPCPNSNNCVCSYATDERHKIAPLPASGEVKTVMEVLVVAIESMPRSRIITLDDGYLHAEFTSRVWRFTDDLECFYDKDSSVIHIRSASRIGRSDFNVNRERVEELRTIFTQMN